MMSEVTGYKPRHKGDIVECFCNCGCFIVDQIMVPFPDCNRHGGPFATNPIRAIMGD